MTLIVAVDGSEQARRALERAIAIADATGTDLEIVHAVDPAVYDEGGGDPAGDRGDVEDRLLIEDVEDAEERGEEILEEAAAIAAEAGIDAGTELLYGDPPNAISEYAESTGAEAVFVGHRGLSERAERLLGSVAKDLVELAPVPVTVVP